MSTYEPTKPQEGQERNALDELIIARVERYLSDLDGVEGLPVYDMIVEAAERPLLKWAMARTGGNQRAAAQLLGMHRNTLHAKLKALGMIKAY